MNYSKLVDAGIDLDSLINRLMGNTSLIPIFIKKFSSDKNFQKLTEAFENENVKDAELASHTLKGMCGNLSLSELYELFTTQVSLIRSGEFEEAKDMMPVLTAKYNKTIDNMVSWVSEL